MQKRGKVLKKESVKINPPRWVIITFPNCRILRQRTKEISIKHKLWTQLHPPTEQVTTKPSTYLLIALITRAGEKKMEIKKHEMKIAKKRKTNKNLKMKLK